MTRHRSKLKGLGVTRPERGNRLARRMWKFYMRHNWWQFNWVRMNMHDAVERATQ